MRFAFVSDNAYPWFNGGIEKRRFVIMRRLASSGNNVHFFTMHREGMPGTEFTYEGIRYHCVGEAGGWSGMYHAGGKRRSIRMPLHFSMRLFFKIFPYRFDILDADSFPFLHIIPLYIYSRIRGVRFAITWHEVWSRKFWKRYLGSAGNIGYFVEWVCARIADVHIANASTTKNLLMQELGVNGNRVLVFPAAVDRQEILNFASRHSCKKKNRFIVVSRLVRHKRVELAIKAIAGTSAKLVVVGVGPELAALKTYAKEHARGKVVFEHGLSDERKLREMCEAKGLIMPSEREGLSLVTLEALAIGTPVVIADTSSLPKEIRGMCLEAKEDEMAGLLNTILKDSGTYEGAAEKLRSSVIKEFSGDRGGRDIQKNSERMGEAGLSLKLIYILHCSIIAFACEGRE